ncbi:MAG: YcbK family protein [Flavobacteriaceae bacterium]
MTQNFKKHEFDCSCGCEMPLTVELNVQRLAEELQYIRNYIQRPITINSGYRCESYNNTIPGSSSRSQHVLGKAADIVVSGMNSTQVFEQLDELQHKGKIHTGGMGLYDTFVHYDIRGYRKRWNYSSNSNVSYSNSTFTESPLVLEKEQKEKISETKSIPVKKVPIRLSSVLSGVGILFSTYIVYVYNYKRGLFDELIQRFLSLPDWIQSFF